MSSSLFTYNQHAKLLLHPHRYPNKNNAPSQVRIDEFPVGSLLMNSLMREVRKEYLANSMLRHKLYQVGVLHLLDGHGKQIFVEVMHVHVA